MAFGNVVPVDDVSGHGYGGSVHDPVSEAPSDGLIDLDVADERSTGVIIRPRRWRRLVAMKVPVPGVVALVLAGVLAGAAGMHLWAGAQQRSRQASEVSLFLTVAGFGASWGVEFGRVTIQGTAAVVNGGPMSVEVSGAANAAAFIVKGQQQLAPDETGWFTVTAIVSCSDGAGVRPLPVDLSVVTSDGRRRAVTVDLQLVGSVWYDVIVQACLHNGNR